MLRSGDPSHDHTENILEFERIVTNVAIAHVTIAHEDDQIKEHKKSLGSMGAGPNLVKPIKVSTRHGAYFTSLLPSLPQTLL